MGLGGRPDLFARARTVAAEHADHRAGRIAELADMEIIEAWIELGTRPHRRTAEHRHLAEVVRPLAYILDPAALDMHSADENRIGPDEIADAHRAHVFVDKADFPSI